MTTIVDVALKAGVSIATVSRVANRQELVVQGTRERVQEAMRQLKYSPTKSANSLRSGAAKSIALLVGDISGPFHATLAKSLSREGRVRGYDIALHDLDNSVEQMVRIVSGLQKSDASGIVIALSEALVSADATDAIAQAQSRGITVVTNSQVVNKTVQAVLPRFDKLASDSVHYLKDVGVGPIAFVGGASDASMTVIGEQGFRLACTEVGQHKDQMACLTGDYMVEPARRAIGRLLRERVGFFKGKERVGVICQTTRMAVGVMLAGFDLGLSVPDQLAIICCEEIPQAVEWRPELTTLAVSMEELAHTLFERLVDKDNRHPLTYLEHKLIIRQST